MSIPDAGSVIHIAELEELDANTCRVLRMIEMTEDEAIVGTLEDGEQRGSMPTPTEHVPHPNTYSNYPDVTASNLDQSTFEGYWAEATALLH